MAAPNIDKTMHDRAKIEKSNVVQQPAKRLNDIISIKLHAFDYPIDAEANGEVIITFNSTDRKFSVPFPKGPHFHDFDNSVLPLSLPHGQFTRDIEFSAVP
jgi:hypothetical protein